MSRNLEVQCIPLSIEEQSAIKALERGEASPGQQQLALSAIVNKICDTHNLSYVPGDTHASAFESGRQYVGYKIIKFVKQPVSDINENQ